jgi:prolyl-tRNA synthetase
MTHGDDDGLRLPPRIAPYHVVVLPIIRDDAARAPVTEACMALAEQLKGAMFAGEGVRVHVDRKDEPTPSKRWSWIKKGAPLICEIGPRDLESGQLALTDRADLSQGKAFLPVAEFVGSVAEKLQHVETRLYEEAVAYRARMTRHDITTFADFSKHFESGSGFVHAKWCGDGDSEKALDDLGVTIRCLPHEQSGTRGNCVLTGRDATVDAVFAKAY